MSALHWHVPLRILPDGMAVSFHLGIDGLELVDIPIYDALVHRILVVTELLINEYQEFRVQERFSNQQPKATQFAELTLLVFNNNPFPGFFNFVRLQFYHLIRHL